MLAIETHQLTKHFNGLTAVDHLDLAVRPGEIFGFLGPNGAGKTTTIRMLMDIIRPDSGRIEILGQPVSTKTLTRIGYLPEERGLYRKLRTLDCLTYLGALKGMDRNQAQQRALSLLQQVELGDFADQKVEALSRGMQQKAQFVATLVHDPELLILDEPFQGLDPLNTELLKDMVQDLHQQGKTIIFSTHQMHQVEELCDRILLIDHGHAVLYGPLREIKEQYAQRVVRLRGEGVSTAVSGASRIERDEEYMLAYLEEDMTAPRFLRQLVDEGASITHYEVVTPPLEEIFIDVVEKGRQVAPRHAHVDFQRSRTPRRQPSEGDPRGGGA